MYTKIQFMSRSDMMFKQPESDVIVISISNPEMENAQIQDGFKDVLFLQFHNTEHLTGNLRRFFKGDAEEILSFVKKHENEASKIYVNCLAGETRSAAVAFFLSKFYDLPLEQDFSLMSKWIVNVLERVVKFQKMDAQEKV